jgi:Lon protease-like protein
MATLADLPASLPVFPLTGVLLLPRGQLPLNIFEPRYLAMTEAALGERQRLIGMIQPRESEGAEGPPKLYPIGCAGRISTFSESGDGRYLITLTGLCRFAVAEELAVDTPYRRVRPDFARFAADLADPPAPTLDRARFIELLKIFLSRQRIKADWRSIAEAPDDGLVTTLAMVCPFQPEEKQALLECRDTTARARVMIQLLEMATLGAPGEGTIRH